MAEKNRYLPIFVVTSLGRETVQVACPHISSLAGVHYLQLVIGMVGTDGNTAAPVDLDPYGLVSAIGADIMYHASIPGRISGPEMMNMEDLP
jgi:hypothetical protein